MPSSDAMWTPTQASQAIGPTIVMPPRSWATAAFVPIVAIVPLSKYFRCSVGLPSRRRTIWRAACRPPCSAGWASCARASSCAAMSPAEKMRSTPFTLRSSFTWMRPPCVCGMPQPETSLCAATPVAQMTCDAGMNSPSAVTTPSGFTSATPVFRRSTTPRFRRIFAAYRRSRGANGLRSSPLRWTRVIEMLPRSISG